jgi:hypothetical protein
MDANVIALLIVCGIFFAVGVPVAVWSTHKPAHPGSGHSPSGGPLPNHPPDTTKPARRYLKFHN